MFKKNNPYKISGKWNYYPIRDVTKNPVKTDDITLHIAMESRESGSEYYQKYLGFVNTQLDRSFVSNCLKLMTAEANFISRTHTYFENSGLTEDEVRLFLAHGYFLQPPKIYLKLQRMMRYQVLVETQ